nr:MAG TPA: hypothetical protein [Bacteriophage sp.]
MVRIYYQYSRLQSILNITKAGNLVTLPAVISIKCKIPF